MNRSWSHRGPIPRQSPVFTGMTVGFPSQRSRVRGPSSALGEVRQAAENPCKSAESLRRSRSCGYATLCDVLHIRQRSWSHHGPIEVPEFGPIGGPITGPAYVKRRAMTSFIERQRRLAAAGLIDEHGELTPRGEDLAEELHRRTRRDVDDDALDHPEPYPDSRLY